MALHLKETHTHSRRRVCLRYTQEHAPDAPATTCVCRNIPLQSPLHWCTQALKGSLLVGKVGRDHGVNKPHYVNHWLINLFPRQPCLQVSMGAPSLCCLL